MIFDPSEHPFNDSYKLMIGSIVPRPIAFVSTQSKNGVFNLAPFLFQWNCSNPPSILFCPARRGNDGKIKDTLNNIRGTEEFVVNIVSEKFSGQMVDCATNFDPDVDEFEISGLTPAASKKITVPRVSEAQISYECKLNQIIPVGSDGPGGGFVVYWLRLYCFILLMTYMKTAVSIFKNCNLSAGLPEIVTPALFQILLK